mgnify:CR=1 FL=1
MVRDSHRRDFLKYGGVVAGTLLAGCAGGDGGSGDGESGDGGSNGGSSGDGSGGSSGDGGSDGSSGDGSSGGDGGDGGSTQTEAQELADTIQMYGIDKFEDRAIGQGFQEQTGTSIETTVLLGGENSGRYLREHRNDVHTADIVQGFDQNNHPIIDAGLVADPELPNKRAVFDEEYETYLEEEVFGNLESPSQAGQLVPLCSILSGFAYNTDLVDDPPTSYEDLLDDRFQDEIIMLSYNVDGWYDQLSREHDEEYAADFIQRLDEQNPQYMGGSPLAALEAVGAGQAKLLPDSFATHVEFMKGQGLPVDWSWGEFIWSQRWTLCLTETAPRMATAKRFCQYAASEAGQQKMAQIFGGVQPFHENVQHPNDNIRQALEEQSPTVRPQAMSREDEQYYESTVEDLIGV